MARSGLPPTNPATSMVSTGFMSSTSANWYSSVATTTAGTAAARRCRWSRSWPTFFDLDLKVQTATDPFFATVSAAKKFWQAAQEVKNEIKIPVLDRDGNTKLLACGSINLHGKFFGERFDIHDGDGAGRAHRLRRARHRALGCWPPLHSTDSTKRAGRSRCARSSSNSPSIQSRKSKETNHATLSGYRQCA